MALTGGSGRPFLLVILVPRTKISMVKSVRLDRFHPDQNSSDRPTRVKSRTPLLEITLKSEITVKIRKSQLKSEITSEIKKSQINHERNPVVV